MVLHYANNGALFLFSHDACAVFFPILTAGPKFHGSVYPQLGVLNPKNSGGRNPVLVADD